MSNAFARVSNGVTRFGLTLGAANTLPILLPPLAEQCAIAAVLQSIDGAIERTDDVIAATERLRDALLHELLTRGVPGWHSAWKDVPGLGTVPTSWEVVRLGDVELSMCGSGKRLPRGGTLGCYDRIGGDPIYGLLTFENRTVRTSTSLRLDDCRTNDVPQKIRNDVYAKVQGVWW